MQLFILEVIERRFRKICMVEWFSNMINKFTNNIVKYFLLFIFHICIILFTGLKCYSAMIM